MINLFCVICEKAGLSDRVQIVLARVEMKKFLKSAYVTILMLISLAPMLLYAANRVGIIKIESANIEKTKVAEAPQLIKNNAINNAFDDECEIWLNQNFPYRGSILSKTNQVLSEVLKNPAANVVAGKDGWLFSTETVDNYMDKNPMSAEEIRALGVTLSLIQEKVESRGGQFVFVPVPNKNSIYPEYMPIRYMKASDNDLTRVYAQLDAADVSYINLMQELTAAKTGSPNQLYYRQDTHWTPMGAIIGYESIMEQFNKTSVIGGDYSYTADNSRVSDLAKLLYPDGSKTDEEFIINWESDYDSFSFVYPSNVTDTEAQLLNFMSDREDHDNDFTTQNTAVGDETALYMVRDSFARAMLPYMIESYSEARFVRSTTPSFLKLNKKTDVVYEICERNLKNVIASAPVMYAPMRDSYDGSVFVSEANTAFCENEGYAYKIYGAVDPLMLGADGRVYVKLAGPEVLMLEAFPTYDGEFGYTVYLNPGILSDGDYKVYILSGNNESEAVAVLSPGNMDGAEEVVFTAEENPYKEENSQHQIVLNGVVIGIGDNINALKGKLGNQTEPQELIVSCLSGEDAMIFHYPNITLETDMDGYIYYISLMEDDIDDAGAEVSTEAGISIGCDKMLIWEKLGTPARENGRNCTYQTEHIKIVYSFKNGAVTSVIMEESPAELLAAVEEEAEVPGMEYSNGNAYLYDEEHEVKKGWQIIDGDYYFFDRITGERVVGQTVDGIVIGADGEVDLTEYDIRKIDTMIKANNIIREITDPADTMEEKRKKAFDWILSFPYHMYRHLQGVYKDEGIEIVFANDIFENEAGDCVSEACALAFLFHEIGYTDVYWVHDTGHSWVRCEDRLFDPVFAEGRDYDSNYNVEFWDYRAMMDYYLLIY